MIEKNDTLGKAKPDQLRAAQIHIAEIDKRINSGFQELAQERLRMNKWEWEQDSQFTVMGLIELYTSYLCGYSSQIASSGKVHNPQSAVKHLREINFFDKPYFVEWYFSPDNDYVKLKKYVESVDYLRFLSFEYINSYKNYFSEATG